MLDKIKKITIYFLIFYALLGFIIIPLVLKPQVIDIVQKETNAKIDIEDIYFNPFTFRLELANTKLTSLDKKELISIKRIILNIQTSSLFYATIHIRDFILEEPSISLVLDKNKKINFASIAKESSDSTKSKEGDSAGYIPRIILDRVAIVDGTLNYEDFSHKSKFDFGLDNIGFELENIDTKDLNTSDANIRFYTVLADGGFVDFKSEIIGLDPFIVKGSLDFEASKLYTQWRYMKDSVNLEVADGKLSLNTDYYFNLNDLESTTLSNLNLSLDKLRVKPKGKNKDVLNLKYLYLLDGTIKPLKQDVHLKKIALNSLDVKVKRDKDGNFDWLEYIKTVEQNEENVKVEEKNADEKESKPWNVLIDEIALEKIKVDFDDSIVKPKVNTVLNSLNLYAQNITLEGKEPLSYQMNLLLNSKFKCDSKGSVIHKSLDAKTYTKCSGLDVTDFVPYIDDVANSELKVYNLKLSSLVAGFDANVTAKDIDSEIVIDVGGANVNLSEFSLSKKSTKRKLATFSSFDVNGITLNTKSKEVGVTDTSLNNLNIRISRLADGTLNVQDLVVPRTKKAVVKKSKSTKKEKEKDYRVQLKKVALKSSTVSFKDKALNPSVTNKINNLYITAFDIDSKKYSWMKYRFFARVNGGGKIKSNGNIRHTPFKQKGSVTVDKVSLKDLTPYIQEHAHIYIDDGYLSLKSKVKYAANKEKPDLNVDGSFKLEEVFVNDSRDKTSLISFSDINLKKFTLEMFPNRLFIDEVDINSFYVNAIVDDNKTMNFASLMKVSEDENVTVEDLNSTVEVDENTTKADPFPVKIVKVNVANGSAHFSDFSLPIKFKTNIHDLNGVVYAISSMPNETSYVDITGEIDRYGSTKLKGSINSGNPKAFTDLDFNFRNLDLSAMSGYSGSFAGYKIDSGKLFLNLNYDIVESKLLGENSIIVKNIEIGEEIENEGNNSIPLGFVIGLLEDGDGVIDIDMPVEGNVDEPDFKYGALVFKTFAKLILKAVVSPFSLLGSMLGVDGDKLGYAEFEGGSLKVLPPEQEKLDNIAKLLVKRPKISISIGGTYNMDVDKKAMQKNKLINLVVKLSGAKNEKERINAMTINLLEDIYEDARDDDKIETIEDALDEKYDGDEFKRAYLQALVKECSNIQEITAEEIQALARNRASVIQSYLIDNKGIDASRISELEIQEVSSDETMLVKSKLEVIVK